MYSFPGRQRHMARCMWHNLKLILCFVQKMCVGGEAWGILNVKFCDIVINAAVFIDVASAAEAGKIPTSITYVGWHDVYMCVSSHPVTFYDKAVTDQNTILWHNENYVVKIVIQCHFLAVAARISTNDVLLSFVPQTTSYPLRSHLRQQLLQEIQLIVMISPWLWCLFNSPCSRRRERRALGERKTFKSETTDEDIKIELGEGKSFISFLAVCDCGKKGKLKLFSEHRINIQTAMRSRFSLKPIIEKRFRSFLLAHVISYDLDRKTIERIKKFCFPAFQ